MTAGNPLRFAEQKSQAVEVVDAVKQDLVSRDVRPHRAEQISEEAGLDGRIDWPADPPVADQASRGAYGLVPAHLLVDGKLDVRLAGETYNFDGVRKDVGQGFLAQQVLARCRRLPDNLQLFA